jgi:hypothetical protein
MDCGICGKVSLLENQSREKGNEPGRPLDTVGNGA